MYSMTIIDSKNNIIERYVGDSREYCADKAHKDGYLVEGMRTFYITKEAWDKGIRYIMMINLVEGYGLVVTDEPYNEEEKYND